MENSYACNIFDLAKYEKYLPKKTYQKFLAFFNHYKKIPLKDLKLIVKAILLWAKEKKCLYYAHTFITFDNHIKEKLNPLYLINDVFNITFNDFIKEEFDASSIAHGQLRNTFAAKGYAYFDLHYFCYINNDILYIPSIIKTNDNYALDNKEAYITSEKHLENNSLKLLKLLNYNDITSIKPYLGQEQEFFIVDKNQWENRIDLYSLNKSLLGNNLIINQELINHYFSQIHSTIKAFFIDVKDTLYSLGIKIKSLHAEVAPNQYEIAPIFDQAYLSLNGNRLIKEVLLTKAEKYNFKIILLEKPFDKINGSGKHNNYSLITNNEINVFSSKDPLLNLLFNTSLIEAIYKYNQLFKYAINEYNNLSRLGGNEAPKNIITISVDENYLNLLNDKESLEKTKTRFYCLKNLNYSERNRTSAVAFSNNKYEFRGLGSSSDGYELNMIINITLSEVLKQYYNDLLNLKAQEELSFIVIKNYLKSRYLMSKDVIYNSNCYTELFVNEMKKRGLDKDLTYLKTISLIALKQYKKIFSENHLFNNKEIKAKIMIKQEEYILKSLQEINVIKSLINKEIKQALIMYSLDLVKLNSNKIFNKTKEYLSKLDTLNQEIDISLTRYRSLKRSHNQALFIQNKIKIEQEKALNIINEIEDFIPRLYFNYKNLNDILSL